MTLTLPLVMPLQAQAEAETVNTGETLITASRTPVLSEQSGSATTVISADELEARQTRFVADVLRQVPGLTVTQSGPRGGLTQVRIRGNEANHTLVIIDGIEVNSPAAGSEYDFSNLLASEIESIEIVRGPQSAIWGSDALGGVINITTKTHSGPLSGNIAAEGGSFDTREVRGGVGGGETLTYSVNAVRHETDGFSAFNENRGFSEDDGYENTTLSLKSGFQPDERFNLDLVGRATLSEADFDEFVLTEDFQYVPADTDSVQETDQYYGLARGNASLLDGNWQHTVLASITDDDTEFKGEFPAESDGRKTKYAYQTDFYFDTPDLLNAEHTLSAVAEREKEDFDFGSSFGDSGGDITNNGYVLEYRLGLVNRLYLSLSGRYDDNDRFENEDTYRASVAYLLPELNSRIHASYGEGIKNPTLFELFGADSQFRPNPDLKPETSEGWDVGLEIRPLPGLLLDVTYFDNEVSDEILTVFNPDFTSTAINGPGTAESHGVELSGRYQLVENLHLTGSYTYTDAEDSAGEKKIRIADNAASLGINFLALEGRLSLNLDAVYEDAREDLNFNTGERVDLDSYTLVNFSLNYQVLPSVTLNARIENLLDEEYEEVFLYGMAERAGYAGVAITF